jgi:hypothetical protein
MPVICPELYKRKFPAYYTKERVAYLRDNQGVDPFMLAEHLGISEVTVQTMQRKLGLRRCANVRDKKY